MFRGDLDKDISELVRQIDSNLEVLKLEGVIDSTRRLEIEGDVEYLRRSLVGINAYVEAREEFDWSMAYLNASFARRKLLRDFDRCKELIKNWEGEVVNILKDIRDFSDGIKYAKEEIDIYVKVIDSSRAYLGFCDDNQFKKSIRIKELYVELNKNKISRYSLLLSLYKKIKFEYDKIPSLYNRGKESLLLGISNKILLLRDEGKVLDKTWSIRDSKLKDELKRVRKESRDLYFKGK